MNRWNRSFSTPATRREASPRASYSPRASASPSRRWAASIILCGCAVWAFVSIFVGALRAADPTPAPNANSAPKSKAVRLRLVDTSTAPDSESPPPPPSSPPAVRAPVRRSLRSDSEAAPTEKPGSAPEPLVPPSVPADTSEPSDDRQPTPAASPRLAASPRAAVRPEPTPAVRPTPADDDATLEIGPASFQDVTPGVTTADELKTLLGPPRKDQPGVDADGQVTTTLTYSLEPFQQVTIVLTERLVTTIRLQLKKPAAPQRLADELELGDSPGVVLYDDRGAANGLLYPEQAVTLHYAVSAKEPQSPSATPQVAEVILERNLAAHFLRRVENDRTHAYQRNLRDLRIAAELDPRNGRAWWLEAKILAAIGRPRQATRAIEEALRRAPDDNAYLLTRAWLWAESGQHTQALHETQTLLAKTLSVADRATAHWQLGRLISSGPTPDFKKAVAQQTAAIQAAATLNGDSRPEVRRAAKLLLLDAHLEMANNIAWGRWSGKAEIVAKWLANAEKIVDDLIANEAADKALRLRVWRATLGAYAVVGGEPERAAGQAIDLGRDLIAEAHDPLYRRQIEWELGNTLCHAMNAARIQDRFDEALRYGDNALALIEPGIREREPSPALDQFLGKLYFTIGSLHAIGKKDHDAAVTWFDRAAERFGVGAPDPQLVDPGQQGERLVSMGVSYWQTGRRDSAVKFTRLGAQWIQRAVKNGSLKEASLAIPYANLASMHQQMGNREEAHSFATLAARLDPPVKSGEAIQR